MVAWPLSYISWSLEVAVGCVLGGVALGEEAVLSGWLRLSPKREVSPAPRIPGEGRLGVAGGPNEGI